MSSTMNTTKMRRKPNVKKAIEFCLMVCGASGSGRTTFVNTLCGKKVLRGKDVGDATKAHIEEDLRIESATVEVEPEEDGTPVSLTVVDTPGFGDKIDNEARQAEPRRNTQRNLLTTGPSFGDIVRYLERQYDDLLAEESRIRRNPRFRDNLVHALLYFITPTGHGLRELDIEFMRRLSDRVNVIPVVGKADSLTPDEVAETKQLIREDIEHYRIPVYNFPYDVDEDDEDTIEASVEVRGLMPFAVVSSEETVVVAGRKIRARQYPWGVVEVDNPRHSDFLALRSAILHSHMADLKGITHDVLYENYRTENLGKSVDRAAGGDAFMKAEDLASHSVRLKEEQLRRGEEKLREIEAKFQQEINEKRQELLARESQLKEMERRMRRK